MLSVLPQPQLHNSCDFTTSYTKKIGRLKPVSQYTRRLPVFKSMSNAHVSFKKREVGGSKEPVAFLTRVRA
jgi:hypothetical protein